MNILLIGNGFDLAHGLPTSYGVFLAFSNCMEKIFTNDESINTEKYIENCLDKSPVKIKPELRELLTNLYESRKSVKKVTGSLLETDVSDKYIGEMYLCYNDKIKGLEAYADPNNRNRVVYYEKDIPQSERIQKVIDDAVKLLPTCKDTHGETTDYQLLERAISEQTKDDGNGHIIPKDKGEMNATILQNPADPEATFRSKAGKEHRGYVANLTETVGENGSIITDYQYDVNTRSDASFIKEYIDNQKESPEAIALITDGAYDSHEIKMQAAKKALQFSQQTLLVNNQILYLLNLRSLLKVRYQNVLLEMFQRALLT